MTLTKYSVPAEVEKKIFAAIELKKELAKYEEEIKSELLEAMKKNDIISIKNDLYSITLAKRVSYSAEDEIPTDFSKTVLDTTKVATHAKLYGEVPTGIKSTTTEYITWRSK
jgi:hypothetical protein